MVADSPEEETVSMPTEIDRRPPTTTALSPPWPMVSISKHQNNNNPPIIFPPSNHENLNIIHIDSYSSSDSGSVSDSDSNSSSSTFSPSASNSQLFSSPKASPVVDDVSRRFESWIEILRLRFYSVVRCLWSNIVFSRSALLSFRSVAGTAVVVLGFLYFRQRRRVRAGENSRRQLIRVIDEKEEKINQLLDQVSRMNQVLLALHKAPTATYDHNQ